MPYTEQIGSTKHNLAETKQAINALQEKKATVIDAAEIKAINKQKAEKRHPSLCELK